MKYYLIAPTLRAHSAGMFTYQSELSLKSGSIVVVEIGKRQSAAVVIKSVAKPKFATKEIVRVVYEKPIPSQLLALAAKISNYYAAPIAATWQTILPRGIEKNRRATILTTKSIIKRKKHSFTLNDAQKEAVKIIESEPQSTSLLQGVTGSGKTAVYIELAKNTINTNNKSVIILIPEIALTSQLVAEFSQYFEDILVTHSGMTESERHKVWESALLSPKPRLVIGPRSALFTPLSNIGLIIIDECHEASFKQEQAPRYSALRAARMLATAHKAKLVLGSATPNVIDRYVAEQNKGTIVRLDSVAKKTGSVSISLIDSRDRKNFTKHRFFSNQFLLEMQQALESKQQVLIFHNRRGSASTTLCENCGWTAGCPRCFVPLVLHADRFQLSCHVCGYHEKVPTSCPKCGKTGVIHKGIGTKLIAEEIAKMFPNKKIVRFDKDTDKDSTLEKTYQSVYDGDVDIIIGTQIIAKGLDLPHLSMVGVVQADGGLSLPDFASSERVFQLLYQVIGRVGRDEKLSTIIVQSFQPSHPAVTLALQKNYDEFYNQTIEQRRHNHFPPFSFLLKLTCSYSSEASAARAARNLKKTLQSHANSSVVFLGPAPAFYERVNNSFRWQLILRSSSRDSLTELLSYIPDVRWQVELDPISLL